MKEEQKQKNDPVSFPKMEEEVLEFWERAKTFEKSVNKEAPEGDYVFYDGPPFATGLPHYGHLAGSIMKDAVPRYQTMKGCRVERKWGWDCHGLPVENLAENELDLKDKQAIENYGVDKFNEYCRSIVLRYAQEWKKTISRIGRWVDMEDDYKTMDPDFMESIWWVFKTLWDKELIYKGYKSMHICPRCGTTLSNFEVGQGYKTIKDISVVAKFKAVDFTPIHTALRKDADVYFLAWTTTPWTLVGNSALAVGEDITYSIILASIPDKSDGEVEALVIPESRVHEEYYIVAKDRIKDIFDSKLAYEVIGEVKGKALVGSAYSPIFDYYSADKSLPGIQNGWKVYPAGFVTTEDGTGIVHIAPAFGEDDMELGKKYSLPFIQHIDSTGRFKEEAVDFKGLEAKPKDDHQKADIEIIKYLAKNHSIFKKEKYEHSYPHCWRCDTPLLNYASDSWFVKVVQMREDLLKSNSGVNWIPDHIKDGRFGKWLSQARDWAISRSRYWGDPLPVWKCESCSQLKVFGSVDDLMRSAGGITKIIFLRHGESEKNVKNIFDSSDDAFGLTEKGRVQARSAGETLTDEKIDAVYTSPVRRARETAQIIAEELGIEPLETQGLREIDSGNWDGKSIADPEVAQERDRYHGLSIEENYIAKRGGNGESWKAMEDRAYETLKRIIDDNPGKTVAVVTHQGLIVYLLKALKDFSLGKTVRVFGHDDIKAFACPIRIYIDQISKKQIDLHKHKIDKVAFPCLSCGDEMRRIPEVLDCWFESGSMPYAQLHYPFENRDKFENNFPAQFIAEGLDQTRGWFYTLTVLSTALFGKEAFQNVIVNGIVLAEDGQKMSKRLKNYPDPAYIFDRYGADATRYYLLSSPVLIAEDLSFSERGVVETLRNTVMTLWNVYKFYELFAYEKESGSVTKSPIGNLVPGITNVLDIWIIARLDQLIMDVTDAMDRYDLPKATRPIEAFISDLSTWYLRRSRDRFKGDDQADKDAALNTTAFVLAELSKVMAPFMPFISEQIWQKVTGNNFKNEDRSVHLEEWPHPYDRESGSENVIAEMADVRKIVEMGLSERDKAGIKVRQPLASLKVRRQKAEGRIKEEYLKLIKDEINIKNIEIEVGDGELVLELDTAITPGLEREGIRRELVRLINALRKEAGLTISDRIIISLESDSTLIRESIEEDEASILRDTLADAFVGKDEEAIGTRKIMKISGNPVMIGIKKV